MKAAPCSWRVRISLIDELRRLSTTSRFSSPGTPKIRSTPSFSSAATNKSDPLAIATSPDALFQTPSARCDPLHLVSLQRRLSQSTNDALGEVACRCLTAEIRRTDSIGIEARQHRLADPHGGVGVVDVFQHQARCEQQGQRVGEPFACNIGSGAMNSLED